MAMESGFKARLRARARLAAAGLLTAGALLAALAGAGPAESSRPSIRVLSAWVRWLPAGLPAAGYLTLENTGSQAASLERASSADFGDVSIHRSVRHGADVQMMPVRSITLPPHQTLQFEPNGYHLMLMQPSDRLATATHVPITLFFADGSSLVASFEIRRRP